jgi:hypothetical protein
MKSWSHFLTVFLAGLLSLSLFSVARAEETPVVVAPVEPAVKVRSLQAPSLLYPYGVHGTLTLGYIAPIKYGLGFTYVRDPNWIWDLSYIKGGLGFGVAGLDFGGFDESLLTLTGRYYPRSGSFNWIIGVSRHAYRVSLGNDFVSRLGGPGATDLLRVETLGLQLGLGNRLTFRDQFWLSIDWLTLNIPITTLRAEGPSYDAYNSSNDRRVVNDALKLMEGLWTMTFLKTSIGYSF